MSTAGIVLCGGQSERMGRSKAWLPWRGEPLLHFQVETLREVLDEVLVVAAPGIDLPAVNALRVDDAGRGLGPLDGIRAGLDAIQAERAFVLGVDTLGVAADSIAALLQFEGVAAPVRAGHLQPLTALYPRRGARAAAELLARGLRRPLDLLEALAYRRLEEAEGPPALQPISLDTPEQYLRAARGEAPGARATVRNLGAAGEALARHSMPIGTLGDLLQGADPAVEIEAGGALPRTLRARLDDREDLLVSMAPIGPGEVVSLQRRA
jgi:molybdopterin-guanine dinucleotide biosynthesis protein A